MKPFFILSALLFTLFCFAQEKSKREIFGADRMGDYYEAATYHKINSKCPDRYICSSKPFNSSLSFNNTLYTRQKWTDDLFDEAFNSDCYSLYLSVGFNAGQKIKSGIVSFYTQHFGFGFAFRHYLKIEGAYHILYRNVKHIPVLEKGSADSVYSGVYPVIGYDADVKSRYSFGFVNIRVRLLGGYRWGLYYGFSPVQLGNIRLHRFMVNAKDANGMPVTYNPEKPDTRIEYPGLNVIKTSLFNMEYYLNSNFSLQFLWSAGYGFKHVEGSHGKLHGDDPFFAEKYIFGSYILFCLNYSFLNIKKKEH
jgi:hypothetical protein